MGSPDGLDGLQLGIQSMKADIVLSLYDMRTLGLRK